jgi:hypothetical protein
MSSTTPTESPQWLSNTRTTRSSTRRSNEDKVLKNAATAAKKVLSTTTEAKKRRVIPPKPTGEAKKRRKSLIDAAPVAVVAEVIEGIEDVDVVVEGNDGADEDPNHVPPNKNLQQLPFIPAAVNKKFTEHEMISLLKVL